MKCIQTYIQNNKSNYNIKLNKRNRKYTKLQKEKILISAAPKPEYSSRVHLCIFFFNFYPNSY